MGLESLPLMASQCSNQVSTLFDGWLQPFAHLWTSSITQLSPQEVLWSSSELAGWASKRSHGVKTWNHRYCVVKARRLTQS